MDSAVDEGQSESGAQDGGQASYAQAGLTSFSQGNSAHNGTEDVNSMAGVTQVMESQGDGSREQTVQVGMGDGNHPASLSISNVPGGVQVAVAVQSADGVSVVEGSLASGGATVDRSDEAHTAGLVTAMPAEYGLATPLSAQYVIQQEQEEGKTRCTVFIICPFISNDFLTSNILGI